jgi:6-phosphogluconolactonase
MSAFHPEILSFADPETLADALADAVAERLRADLGEGRRAGLVVSGGSTPAPFFRRLAEHDLDWHRVIVTLADERWVNRNHEASNERLVRSLLLQNRARTALFVPLKNSAPAARPGEEECHRTLARLPRPFAAVILGMGVDGHTASLFPGTKRLADALDMRSGRNCLALSPAGAPYERMTLTLPVLLDSKLIILHITGQAKRKVLEQALAEGPEMLMPVRAVLRQKTTPVHIYWAP